MSCIVLNVGIKQVTAKLKEKKKKKKISLSFVNPSAHRIEIEGMCCDRTGENRRCDGGRWLEGGSRVVPC